MLITWALFFLPSCENKLIGYVDNPVYLCGYCAK